MEENKTVSCVNCSVKNCIHHTAQDRCDAGKITVGSEEADTCGQTFCDTFSPREYR